MGYEGQITLLILILIVLLIFGSKGIKIVRPYQRGVVERLGRYNRTLESGLNLVVPFVERMRKVDMREHVVDVPPQEVITKDNVVVTVDAVVYYEVTEPFKVLYNVADFFSAIIKLAQTNLRNIIGDMELDETLTSRERINAQLRQLLDEATDKWGTRIVRVEIQRIDPPTDITAAMSKQMKAEREKRAVILEAEGYRQAQIERAEGEKRATILKAEGQAEAVRKKADAEKYRQIAVAEGEARAIVNVFTSIHEGRPTKDLIAIKYLEALQRVAEGKATKIFLPMESSGILGSLAGISELFKDTGSEQQEE